MKNYKVECILCGKIMKEKRLHICYDHKLRFGEYQMVRECCIAGCNEILYIDNENSIESLCWKHQNCFDRFQEEA